MASWLSSSFDDNLRSSGSLRGSREWRHNSSWLPRRAGVNPLGTVFFCGGLLIQIRYFFRQITRVMNDSIAFFKSTPQIQRKLKRKNKKYQQKHIRRGKIKPTSGNRLKKWFEIWMQRNRKVHCVFHHYSTSRTSKRDWNLPEVIDGIFLKGVWFFLRLRTIASLLGSDHPAALLRTLQRKQRLFRIFKNKYN